MERHGMSVNVGSFVGGATVRMYAKGMAVGPPTPAELDTMRAVMRRAMEDGAFGLGTALIYPPGSFATTAELVEIAKAMSPYGGVYITHMRSEADQLLEAIDEALRIGREGGVPVEIYHFKAGGRRNWAKAALAIATIFFLMSEDNVALQLRQPWIKFGTDADGVDPDSVRTLTHPRAYGNYPRILGTYVREQRILTLEDAIRKMTSAVANRLSIQDRGLLREGMYADVVVFDPRTIADRATFEQPHQLSVGVRYVFVNGTAVVRDGRHTGAKPGRPVRGPGYAR